MTTDTLARAGKREWVGLAVLGLPTLLLSLDMSVLYLALPHLSAELGATGVQQLWITDIYGFMIAGFLVTMGTVGDRVGRRKLLLIGAVAFGVASVVAALSTSAEMLIAARALLGVAGATLMPSTLALIGNMFADPRQRGLAIGVWMSCFLGGVAAGPIIGGALLGAFWWGAAFLLGVPVMLVLLVAGPLLLPEFRAPQAGRVDLASVALSLAAILPLIYGLKELAQAGRQPLPLAAILAGVIFAVAFVRRQRRLADPLLDLRLFSDRTFSSALGVWLLFGAVQGGSYLFFALYLQVVAGLSPIEAGLRLVPSAIAMIVASLLAPVLARRIRPGSLIAAGLLVAAGGYVVLTLVDGGGGVPIVVAGLVVSLFGVGVAGALGTGLIIGSVPSAKTGSAAALSETSGQFGIALGIAVMGTIGTVLYQGRFAAPEGLPAGVASAAEESIAGATIAARTLPGDAATRLLDAARDAFSSGISSLAWISALFFVALAILAAVTLRQAPPTGGAVPAEEDGRHADEVARA
ncbi:MFS transporter [Nonomuraea sp. NPDC046570]|uniref:MFS transporter n=1 Tax=Nonomuraea sp. NPDC046570 TaxID=3155255 RepID=UPI0033C46A78